MDSPTGSRPSDQPVPGDRAPRAFPRPILLAYLPWAVLACAVLVKTLTAPSSHTVFPKFAAGAAHWWAGLPLYAYHEGLGAFRYSPTFAIAMTPFALLGLRLGGAVWVLSGTLLYLIALRGLIRDVLPGDWPTRREALLIFLTIFAGIRGVWNAQSNIWVGAFLMLGALAIVRRRWWSAGVLLAIPVFLKVSPIAVALVVVALWPRKLLLPFAIALLVGLLIPFLTQSPAYVVNQYNGWYQHLAETSTSRWPNFRDAWTVWELFQKPVNIQGYRLLQVLTGLMVLGWCLWQRRSQTPIQGLLTPTLSLGIAWLLIFGPAVEFNAYVLLAPFLCWALLAAYSRRRGRALISAAFVLATFLGSGAVERVLIRVCPWFNSALPLGAILFVVWLVVYAWMPWPRTHDAIRTEGIGPA